MLTVITRIGRLLIVALFAAALTFGVSQAVSAAPGSMCDTPDEVCGNNYNCLLQCHIYAGTEKGGECILPRGCCDCFM